MNNSYDYISKDKKILTINNSIIVMHSPYIPITLTIIFHKKHRLRHIFRLALMKHEYIFKLHPQVKAVMQVSLPTKMITDAN